MSNEYQYALSLSIRNAKIFHKNFKNIKSGDRVFDENKNFSLRTEDQWINQIEYDKLNNCYQFKFDGSFVNNVLRVLCGQRPISRYRTKYHYMINFDRPIDQNIQDMSSRTLVKIDKTRFFKEVSTVEKASIDSWGKLIPTWEYIKIYLQWKNKNDLFDKFINLSCNLCLDKYDIIKSKTLYEYIILLGDYKYKNNFDIQEFLNEIKNDKDMTKEYKKLFLEANSSLEYKEFYEKNDFCKGFGKESLYYKKYILHACSNIFFVNGNFLVLLRDDEEKKLFSRGTGSASIFDNGLVNIERIYDLSKINLDMLKLGYSRCDNVLSI